MKSMHFTHRRRATGYSLLSVGLLLLGCDDGPSEPKPAPSFEISVSGDVSRSLQGSQAYFHNGETAAGPSSVLSLRLGSGPLVEGIDFLRVSSFLRASKWPSQGTYSLSDASLPDLLPPGEFGAFVVLQATGSEPGFIGSAKSGTITITTSTSNVVRGDFALEAAGNIFLPAGGAATAAGVTLTGSFEAIPE